MAFIGNKKLKEILEGTDVIKPFEKEHIKNGAYELSLGDEAFQTDTKPRSIKKLNPAEKIYIEPGQFALLLTEEKVKIPQDKIAFISIKAGIKFKGLVNVSGFHVDPGFEGKLLFSVYNAGPSTIVLNRGEKCFPIWFAEITETDDYRGDHDKQQNIPNKPVEALSQGELASPNVLSKRIDDNQNELNTKIDETQSSLITKIGLLEKEQTAKDYLIKTAVGLGIIILFKFVLDWISYNNGFEQGLELKKKQTTTDSIINSRLIEKKKLILEIDSLEKHKSELEQLKTKKNEN
ncbi:dCTP deaminase domain-containing protein [Flavobacterium sp.]|jgi:dCTP deaminase|uniref:dCTP deaminase domain-containing protein n=1 Tax=Flavobacterium sp. TaxID=239 RepID=UPI0037C021E8